MKSLEGTQVRYTSDQIALAQHTSFLEYFRPLLHFFFTLLATLSTAMSATMSISAFKKRLGCRLLRQSFDQKGTTGKYEKFQ